MNLKTETCTELLTALGFDTILPVQRCVLVTALEGLSEPARRDLYWALNKTLADPPAPTETARLTTGSQVLVRGVIAEMPGEGVALVRIPASLGPVRVLPVRVALLETAPQGAPLYRKEGDFLVEREPQGAPDVCSCGHRQWAHNGSGFCNTCSCGRFTTPSGVVK